VLIVPGGYLHKFPRFWEADDVRSWVKDGGGYVGICGGEIVAIEGRVVDSFFGSFQGLEIAPNVYRVNPRWVGPRNIRMTEKGSGLLGLSGDQRILHWNGSILGYHGTPREGKNVFAIYENNGPDLEDPEHGGNRWNPRWNSSAAILGDNFGEGRLILSGPHPEFPSENGKYQKPRLIGAMVKWAFRDDTSVPVIVGREDRLPGRMTASTLMAMSNRITVDTSLSGISIYVERASGRGILGVYADNGKGRPGRLLATTGPFRLDSGEGWRSLSLKSDLHLEEGRTVWLAWMFENETVLAIDDAGRGGDLGDTRIRTSQHWWRSTWRDELPLHFPASGETMKKITAVFAFGEVR
jgi:hypothetical protein